MGTKKRAELTVRNLLWGGGGVIPRHRSVEETSRKNPSCALGKDSVSDPTAGERAFSCEAAQAVSQALNLPGIHYTPVPDGNPLLQRQASPR